MGNRGTPQRQRRFKTIRNVTGSPTRGGGGGGYQGEENGAGIRDFRNQKCGEKCALLPKALRTLGFLTAKNERIITCPVTCLP